MATGFVDVDDTYKRYFDEQGHMVTGWQEIGGSVYYFRASGAMQMGEATIDDVTYEFSSKGVLLGVISAQSEADSTEDTSTQDDTSVIALA